MTLTDLSCSKCGKTVEVLEDDNYNKILPEGWEKRIIYTKKEPCNPIKLAICNECIKKEEKKKKDKKDF